MTILEQSLIDIPELAEVLKISVPLIRKLVRGKRIPYLRIGRLIRFDRQEIRSWLDELREIGKDNRGRR